MRSLRIMFQDHQSGRMDLRRAKRRTRPARIRSHDAIRPTRQRPGRAHIHHERAHTRHDLTPIRGVRVRTLPREPARIHHERSIRIRAIREDRAIRAVRAIRGHQAGRSARTRVLMRQAVPAGVPLLAEVARRMFPAGHTEFGVVQKCRPSGGGFYVYGDDVTIAGVVAVNFFHRLPIC
jgi:hypothetical protein